MARPWWLTVNRALLAPFAVLLIVVTVIAIHEIFFAVPSCPGGAADCMMRTGHYAGSRLIGAVLLGLWLFTLSWLVTTRQAERRGTAGFVPVFWAGPLLILCFFYFQ